MRLRELNVGCFGGGTGFVAACDVVVASEDAIFSISETRWGLMAGIILPQLCRAMSPRQVRRYALTGERFDAHEARRLGLVHEVCPVGGLDAVGARIVDAVLMNAPGATAETKLRTLRLADAFVEQLGQVASGIVGDDALTLGLADDGGTMRFEAR